MRTTEAGLLRQRSGLGLLHFYVGLLGLRLVKRTVNFDDPGMYHFYYGDEVGHPGTVLTFFPIPGVPRGRRGTGRNCPPQGSPGIDG